MAHNARVRTDSGYVQAPMDDNEGTRNTAMTRDVGPDIGSGCRGVWRVAQTISNSAEGIKIAQALFSS